MKAVLLILCFSFCLYVPGESQKSGLRIKIGNILIVTGMGTMFINFPYLEQWDKNFNTNEIMFISGVAIVITGAIIKHERKENHYQRLNYCLYNSEIMDENFRKELEGMAIKKSKAKKSHYEDLNQLVSLIAVLRLEKSICDLDKQAYQFFRNRINKIEEEIKALEKRFIELDEPEEHELNIWQDEDGELMVRCVVHGQNAEYISDRPWNKFKEGNFILKCPVKDQ